MYTEEFSVDTGEYSEETVDIRNIEDESIQSVTVEELLISSVQVRPPLWDSRLPVKDRSKTIRDQLWLEVFEQFGENPEYSVEYLIKKWRNLRDTYVRLKGEYTPSGSAAKKKKKWEFFDNMAFLNDTINFRPTVSNVASSSTSSTSSPMLSPTLRLDAGQETRQNKGPQKIEGAIIDALNKINTPTEVIQSNPVINPICSRISEMLNQMPQQPRTKLEIKLLTEAFEGAKTYLK